MIKIAIVEDEIEMSSDLKKHVETFFNQHDKKITIDIFDNAVKFLDKYKSKYDLVFMDINLPYMDGIEASEKLRKIDPTVIMF